MKTPRNPCQHCKQALPAGKQKYCGADCKQAAYRQRAKTELGEELAGNLRQVHRLIEAGEIPAEYGEQLDDLRELVKRAADVPALMVGLLENVVQLAMLHHRRATEGGADIPAALDYYAAVVGKVAEVEFTGLLGLAREARELSEAASETYAEGVIGAELESIIYARQVGHHYQTNEYNEGDSDGAATY